MLIGLIVAFFLAAILFVVFLFPPSLAMAQQQTTSTAPTISSSPSSLSITTIPPLTPEELQQQNRLQNVIAATTRDLNETEKQVSGVVFTPRWSEPIWVNANSVAVLVAYCLPGEFADSGQEILGGFGLEVLESYAVDLPQGFMAWMAVVGNEDGNVRLPAAQGVICASDLNNTDTRILSPQEQQQINNINQQFSTIQNTQITNIDQVINIINNVTEPTTTEEGQQPLTVEVSANATEAYKPATIRFDSKVTGGTAPYSYTWRSADGGGQAIGYQRNLVAQFEEGSTDIIILNVTDSKNKTASDSVPITLKERPFTVEIIPNATQAVVPAYIKFDANITGGTEPYSYTWDYGDPDSKPHGRSLNLVLVKAHLLNVILTVTDSRSKTATDTVQIPVEAPPPPTVQIISNATEGVAPATFSFEVNLNAGSQPYNWLWDFGDGEISQQQTVEHTFDQPGTYNVVLQVTDYGGSGSDNIVITVKEREPGVLLPPETGQEGQPPGGGGLLPSTPPPPPNDNEVISPPEGGGGGSPPEAGEEGGGEEEPSPPPSDDTEEGEGMPPSTTEEEPTTPPDGGG
jgi:PKD repeat protein